MWNRIRVAKVISTEPVRNSYERRGWSSNFIKKTGCLFSCSYVLLHNSTLHSHEATGNIFSCTQSCQRKS